MSDERYYAGIKTGLLKSSGLGVGHGFPWPAAVPGLGAFGGGDGLFGRCEDCPPAVHIAAAGTWVAYAGRRLCLACARARVKGAAA